MSPVVVIGAGVSGLTCAALLARSEQPVLVVERHTVAGGCASFYQRNGYRFDVGATLISGFGPRGIHRRLFDSFGVRLDAVPVEPSMLVHIEGETIVRWGDERWAAERSRAFGPSAEPFWREQERLAALAWDFSSRFPALPQDASGALAALHAFRPRHLRLAAALGRTVESILPKGAAPRLRAFVDAQLLITAQAVAGEADLAYGATALDLAREGTYHLPDGVSAIAAALARVVRKAGSRIAYRSSVKTIRTGRRGVEAVVLDDGSEIATRCVVAAVPLQAVARMVELPARLTRRIAEIPQRWGAFTAYVGLPAGVVADDLPLHHQIVSDARLPLGEGNSIFLSFSGPGELRRARGGGRAVTISTHTDVARWERAAIDGSLDARRAAYGAGLMRALEGVVPGASGRAEIVEFGTPLTFEYYTGRPRGLVGGLPQTPAYANLRAVGHCSGVPGLYLCGDTAFPGQSTVGASLSGVAAARAAAQLSFSSIRSLNLPSSVR